MLSTVSNRSRLFPGIAIATLVFTIATIATRVDAAPGKQPENLALSQATELTAKPRVLAYQKD